MGNVNQCVKMNNVKETLHSVVRAQRVKRLLGWVGLLIYSILHTSSPTVCLHLWLQTANILFSLEWSGNN